MKFPLYMAMAIVVALAFQACRSHGEGHDHEHESGCEDRDHGSNEDGSDESLPEGVIRFSDAQAQRIGLAVERPVAMPFGQVIKTTARVMPGQSDGVVVAARMDGIVVFDGPAVTEGMDVRAGQRLFAVSSAGLAENSLGVRMAEAQSACEKAAADFRRAQELVGDKIVSEKEYLRTKSDYEAAKARYDNLRESFSGGGQQVSSPRPGYVREVHVANGQYVAAGDALVSIAGGRSLLLKADVPVRYAPLLNAIRTATVRRMNEREGHSLESLNGRVLSVGKSVNDDNFLLPVVFQIDNRAGFIAGSFVEMYIRTASGQEAMTVARTALTEEQGIYFVYVRLRPGQYEKREVQTGVTDGIRTEIISGLTGDEEVVVRGAVSVKLAQDSEAPDPHAGHAH